MNTPDLFEDISAFTRTGSSIVPPTPAELAAQRAAHLAAHRRDRGIKRAAEHAGKQWQERALGYVREYVATHRGPFLCEDVRGYADHRDFEHPPTAKAWGGVMQTAARRGIVVADGWAPAQSSNLSAKRLWKSLVGA